MNLFGKSGCLRAEVVVYGKKCIYSGKSGCIWAKFLSSYKSGCNRAKWLVF